MKELICIVCPKGCHLRVDEENGFAVTGNSCPRGESYGKTELQNPTRVLTSTVCISGGIHRRLPVKTNTPIPKGLLFEAMRCLDTVKVQAPVHAGEVIVSNLLSTGADVVAARDMASL
jgi:CxxC motif-containing protein